MERFDLLIIGGGINGAAIARDAAIRGAKVLLVEKDDLAQHTSSASSKLIHGGLRYLEQRDFRLVRESLREREVLLRTAPHIVRPLQFVLPDPKGGRPWWMIRLGLFLYDLLAGRSSLPRSRGVQKGDTVLRAPLRDGNFRLASYWDAMADDSRLVVLNVLDAAEHGAEIATRTAFLSAHREDDAWRARLSDGREVHAGAIANAAGPWVAEVLSQRLGEQSRTGVRLIRGSHIAVPRISEGDHAYILQQPDGRIVFALPYGGCTLVGTTDVPATTPDDARVTADEVAYLCAAANAYFTRPLSPGDVVWSYAGVRALYDDGDPDPKAVTRDYRLELDHRPGARLLSVFGGKITTARALAEEALDRLGIEGRRSTDSAFLPGGELTPAFNLYLDHVGRWMPPAMLARLARAYGTRLRDLLGDASALADLGEAFGAGLYEREARYLVDREFARTADDILWRRTKCGLDMTPDQRRRVAKWVAAEGVVERRQA